MLKLQKSWLIILNKYLGMLKNKKEFQTKLIKYLEKIQKFNKILLNSRN